MPPENSCGYWFTRCSGSGLADDPERLPGKDVVGDAGDGADDPVVRVEFDRQVTDGQKGLGHTVRYARTRRWVGSRASRRPSPMKLMHRAISTITRPGNVTSHHSFSPSLCPSSISFPS